MIVETYEKYVKTTQDSFPEDILEFAVIDDDIETWYGITTIKAFSSDWLLFGEIGGSTLVSVGTKYGSDELDVAEEIRKLLEYREAGDEDLIYSIRKA